MRVGVPSEIKPGEHRVGLTPTAVREYVGHGHTVLVQSGAGLGAGYADDVYVKAGATIAPDAAACTPLASCGQQAEHGARPFSVSKQCLGPALNASGLRGCGVRTVRVHYCHKHE